MKPLTVLLILSVAVVAAIVPGAVSADTFGSGATAFDIEFISIGNSGNAADTTGIPNPAGSVPYSYRIGRYEISEGMINSANAEAALGITTDNRGPDKPATNVTWLESIKFVNWLNVNAGSPPAYKVSAAGAFELWEPSDAGFDPDNRFRSTLARYFLPNIDEWYKAAYFAPTTGTYFDYPHGSDSVPDGLDSLNDTLFEAVFTEFVGGPPEPRAVTDVGLPSPYGTYGQGGNVHEWLETEYDFVNDSTTSPRSVRGGDWNSGPNGLRSGSHFFVTAPSSIAVGIRVASVIPEPSSLYLLVLSGVGFMGMRFR